MAEVKVRVGASLDANGTNLFRPLVASAKKARQQINAEFAKITVSGAVAKGQAGMTGSAQRETTKRIKLSDQETQATIRNAEKAAAAKIRADDKAYREIERHVAKLEREEARSMAKTAAAQSRSARLAGQASRGQQIADFRSGVRIGHQSLTNVSRFGGQAVGMGRQIAQGAGVDFGVSSLVSKVVGLERQSVALSNAGFMRGQVDEQGRATANSRRVSSDVLTQKVREVSTATASDAGDVMAGLSAFVAKSGDLDTGRKALADLAKLAKATGTEISDMTDAAGDVAAQLPDSADKAEKVVAIMRNISAQGRAGAVEVKDLAKQMAGLAAASSGFSGKAEDNIETMGVLAQESRKRGGSKSAAQAVTSVQSFANTFDKGTREKQFKAAGVQTRDEGGMLRDAKDIIIDSLRATGGNSVEMGKLFADTRARSATRGFETVYKRAGGGEKGIEAVKKEFAELRQATLTKAAVDEDFAKAMETAASKAQLFQNQLERVVEAAASKVLPALEKLGPSVLTAAEAMSKFIKFGAENPGKLIALAIVASITKAALGEAIARAIGNKLLPNTGVGPLGAGGTAVSPGTTAVKGAKGAAVAGALGAAGTALTIAAAAVTIAAVGSLIIDKVMDKKTEGDTADANEDIRRFGVEAAMKRVGAGKGTAADAETLKTEKSRIFQETEASRRAQAERDSLASGGMFGGDTGTAMAQHIMRMISGDDGGSAGLSKQLDFKELVKRTTDSAKLEALMATANGHLATIAKNAAPTGGAPGTDGTARTGP